MAFCFSGSLLRANINIVFFLFNIVIVNIVIVVLNKFLLLLTRSGVSNIALTGPCSHRFSAVAILSARNTQNLC